MSAQLYYLHFSDDDHTPALSDDLLHHLIHVVRIKHGEAFDLCNGRGRVIQCTVTGVQKKAIQYSVVQVVQHTRPTYDLHVAISFTKQAARTEWFLEKATEIGITTITPLTTSRSEKIHTRQERFEKILQAAMQQSKQYFLPTLTPPLAIEDIVQTKADVKCIAWCDEHIEKKSLSEVLQKDKKTLILIGPEGDFSAEEVSLCRQHSFIPVSLGHTRLRTETAGIVACVLFHAL